MSVPLQDPAREHRALRERLEPALLEVAASGRYVLGPRGEAFEGELARYLGVEHVVGVGSGTDALVLSLRALGIGRGDEVVVPPFSFLATAEAVLRVGAEPVFADVRPGTFDLDPEAADAAVTERTAALLPVHLYGQMADVEALGEVADRHGLALVEDAAQALGAARLVAASGDEDGERSWLRAGAVGDVGIFSFYPTKNLAALGDAGAVATDDAETAARLRRLRDHGRDPARGGGHPELGWNSRLDELQAAALRVKLEVLDEWNGRRRRHARAYDRAFGELGGIQAPPVASGNRHVYQQYTIRCDDRDALAGALSDRGVGHAVYYPVPLHRQPALAEALARGRRGGGASDVAPPDDGGRVPEAERAPPDDTGRFPVAERAAREVLSLPVFPLLEDDERERVIEAVRDALG